MSRDVSPVHDIRERGWVKETPVGNKITALEYPDGRIGISHECILPRSGYHVLYAPKLQIGGGHSVTSSEPLTVTPSILCGECGLHGFITNGAWMSC
jgi:hypothetical protein